MNKLKWDSDFFKKSVYEINLDIDSVPINFNSIDVLYLKSSKNFDIEISGYKKTLEENKIDFSKELIDINIDDIDVVSIFNTSISDERKEELYQLAYISGENSRFLLDKNFGRNSFELLYKKWIDNSLSREIANEFFIYKSNNQILGFITVSIKDGIGKVGLFAVDPKTQGKGLGTKLLTKTENYLIEKNIRKIIIPTQLNNLKACNFYKKSGYEIETNLFIKHYWKNDTI